ncbi:hypothetical protein [Rubritalea tangerina]|uniref:hypothetical protein n=1 Tax=Rubritalea tangerina TaxID=430798 RepID=UPI0036223E0B
MNSLMWQCVEMFLLEWCQRSSDYTNYQKLLLIRIKIDLTTLIRNWPALLRKERSLGGA